MVWCENSSKLKDGILDANIRNEGQFTLRLIKDIIPLRSVMQSSASYVGLPTRNASVKKTPVANFRQDEHNEHGLCQQ